MTRGRLFRIGFIGLGKLGMPCAEVFAEQHDVVGYDLCPRSSQSVRIARSFSEAVLDRDIIFVAVQTPHDPAYGGKAPIAKMPPKDFDYGHVKRVLQHLNKITSSEQLIVLISTVLPGTCREQLAPLLSNARLIYNPYLIAMGSVKWDLVNPEMIIVGTEDGSLQGEAENLYELYESLVRLPRYVLATWDEAECVKIFYNTFISMKIGIANMLQDVAEAVGNINVDVITDALKMANQRVISPRYLTAGMGMVVHAIPATISRFGSWHSTLASAMICFKAL